jgi:hypothetical protein
MVAALLLASLGAGSALAQGIPSQSKLSKMGLSSMKVVSDDVGSQVRGKAFATVGGQIRAATGGAFFGPWGWGGFPLTGPGGNAVSFTGSAVSGSLAPDIFAPAEAKFGTATPIFLQNTVTVNGNTAASSAFVTGKVFAFGL